MKSINEILSNLPTKIHRTLDEKKSTNGDEKSIQQIEIAQIKSQVHGDQNITRLPCTEEETNSHPKLRALEVEKSTKRRK